MKKLVIGNACIDGILCSDVSSDVRENSVLLEYGGKGVEIKVEGGPIKAGGKYTAKEDFCHALQEFSRIEQFGGGGFLSVSTLRKITDDELFYLDISTPSLDTSIPGTSLADRLDSMKVNPYFLSAKPMPFNVVLGKRADKIVLRSRQSKPVFGEYCNYLIDALMQDCDGIMFNSLKNVSLVEKVIDSALNGKTVVGVITDSLDPDYVLEKLVPNIICQFNYDEFGYIVNPDHKVIGDEDTRIESAYEGIKKIRRDYHGNNHLFVTLGKNGVLCSNESEIYHVRLKDESLEKIQECVNKNPTSTCGAGDAHGASVFNDEITRLSVREIAQRACAVAVRYLGYNGKLSKVDFV